MKIGITGGSGSGKSTLSKYIKSKGYTVIDADEIAHEIIKKPEIVAVIEKVFGSEYIKDSKLDRKKMARLIFTSKEKRELYQKIVTSPTVSTIKVLLSFVKEHELVFVDAPLLFETGLYQDMDVNILITAPLNDKLNRIMARDNIPPFAAKARIDAQLADEMKLEFSDFVIENTGTIDAFTRNFEDVLLKLEAMNA